METEKSKADEVSAKETSKDGGIASTSCDPDTIREEARDVESKTETKGTNLIEKVESKPGEEALDDLNKTIPKPAEEMSSGGPLENVKFESSSEVIFDDTLIAHVELQENLDVLNRSPCELPDEDYYEFIDATNEIVSPVPLAGGVKDLEKELVVTKSSEESNDVEQEEISDFLNQLSSVCEPDEKALILKETRKSSVDTNRETKDPVTEQDTDSSKTSNTAIASEIIDASPIEMMDTTENNAELQTKPAEDLNLFKSPEKVEMDIDVDETKRTRRSETPEDIINLLKTLSPEKLEVIKSQVFSKALEPSSSVKIVEAKIVEPTEELMDIEVSKSDERENVEPMIIDEPNLLDLEGTNSATQDKLGNEHEKEQPKKVNEDIVVILSDSEEETDDQISKEPLAIANEAIEVVKEKQVQDIPSNSTTIKAHENQEVQQQSYIRKKECINIECSGKSSDFFESTGFALSYFYVPKKANKVSYVCEICYEEACGKYEEMVQALLNNNPLVDVKIPKKNERVEVLDSDDEDEATEPTFTSDAEKIEWNEEMDSKIEGILQEICKRVDFNQQLKWENERIKTEIADVNKEQELMEKELQVLEKKSNMMYNELYAINKPRIERRQSISIVQEIETKVKIVSELKTLLTEKESSRFPVKFANPNSTVAPVVPGTSTVVSRVRPGEIIPVSQVYYAVITSIKGRMQNWAPCRKLETLNNPDGTKKYRVQFFDTIKQSILVVDGKSFALNTSNVKLQIGARVLCQFTRPNSKTKESVKKYLPGVVGEKLSRYNQHRYLVFCDYGQVQYATPESVREISEASPNVWEDVHENLKQFIIDYLRSKTQCQRALLNLRLNQRVMTERNGTWRQAIVNSIDCSIVKMFFSEENAYEWLYRGSKRLGPLFSQGQRAMNSNARRNDPNIVYISIDGDYAKSTDTESDADKQLETEPDSDKQSEAEPDANENKRNTARKSTAPRSSASATNQQQAKIVIHPPAQVMGPAQPKVIILNDDKIYLDDPNKVCKTRHFTPSKGIEPKKYIRHDCSPLCLPKPKGTLLMYSPLTKPLLSHWAREIVRQKSGKWVMYKAPCGRRLRNMFEIRHYLMITRSTLNVDNFDFDTFMQVLIAHDVIDKAKCPLYIPDMSNGKEGMKIPIINAFDDKPPPMLEYSAVRIPMKGVNINTDPDFMACCDCTDDCADKTKCACFQLTIQGYKYANRGEEVDDNDISYVWKRLLAPVRTGVYECNSRCKCSSRCLNKVVQHPIQVKMQLYRTKERGWGLESCHDIPKGTFICIYAGRLYTEDEANALCQGIDHGDEYFAELDLIETATPLKEGYEAGVILEDSDSDADKSADSDSDYDERKAEQDEEFISRAKSGSNIERVTRSARSEKTHKSSTDGKSSHDSDSESEIMNMMPTAPGSSNPKAVRSFRKLYGKNEKVHIMDAKQCGNVGRYFNHSCDPNLFVESVLVDTHDIRFPWIAFFANRSIKAGEELTWNYNYEVGSVPSKVLFCKCGAKNCRGRIL